MTEATIVGNWAMQGMAFLLTGAIGLGCAAALLFGVIWFVRTFSR